MDLNLGAEYNLKNHWTSVGIGHMKVMIFHIILILLKFVHICYNEMDLATW